MEKVSSKKEPCTLSTRLFVQLDSETPNNPFGGEPIQIVLLYPFHMCLNTVKSTFPHQVIKLYNFFTPTRFGVLSHGYFKPFFRLISVRFPSNFFVFLCVPTVLSPIGTVLVSTSGIIFPPKWTEKNTLFFCSNDTFL